MSQFASVLWPTIADKLKNMIDGRKRLFEACRCNQCIFRRLVNGTDNDDDQDDDPDLDPDQRRPADNEPDEDDESDGHDNHPRPHPDNNDNGGDDDDDDDFDNFDWQHELEMLRRPSPLDSGPEDNEDDPLFDHDHDLIDVPYDINEDLHMEDDVDEDLNMIDDLDDPSQSPPLFVPHSRQTSPEATTQSTMLDEDNDFLFDNDLNHNSDMVIDDISDIDRMVTSRSPTRLASPIQPKLEPKVEPEEEVMTRSEYTRPRQTYDLVDLTEDSDESTSSSRSSTMEVIELTEDIEPARTINRYEDVIDLTPDSEEPQSPMEVIDLDD
jgi:hypothetical protein